MSPCWESLLGVMRFQNRDTFLHVVRGCIPSVLLQILELNVGSGKTTETFAGTQRQMMATVFQRP